MDDLTYFKEIVIGILMLITFFFGLGTSIWFWSIKPFKRLKAKIKEIDESDVNLSSIQITTISQLREYEKCGKKIVVTQFMGNQATKFSRRAWERCLKTWGTAAFICLVSLCSIMGTFSKDIKLPEILHKVLATTTSILVSVSFVTYLLAVFCEFWLLKSQLHEYDDIL